MADKTVKVLKRTVRPRDRYDDEAPSWEYPRVILEGNKLKPLGVQPGDRINVEAAADGSSLTLTKVVPEELPEELDELSSDELPEI